MRFNDCDTKSDPSKLSNKGQIICDELIFNTVDPYEIDNDNLKAISAMDDYLRSLFHLFTTLYKSSKSMIDDLYELLNKLNFRTVDEQFIEEYNKALLFMYETTKSVLSSSVTLINGTSFQLINIPNDETKTYSHKIMLILIEQNSNYMNHFLGNITNMSITMVNDQITFQRGSKKYIFVTFDNTVEMSNTDFRTHLDSYVLMMKEIMGSYYNDVSFVKTAYKTFLRIVKDLFGESVKSCHPKSKDARKLMVKWEHTLAQLKSSLELIDKYSIQIDCMEN
jgi:hypothetical protein